MYEEDKQWSSLVKSADVSKVNNFQYFYPKVSKPYGAGAMNGGGEVCCGSALPEFFTVPTQPFERHVTAGSFAPPAVEYFINEDGRPQMRDVFPPSR